MTRTEETSKKRSHWIVVADESRAIVYERENRRSPIGQLLVLENTLAREKTENLLADRGGRSFDSHGQGRHTMARENTGPKQQLAAAFAKTIAARIVKARHGGECRDFGLIAAPAFLGTLRSALSLAKNVEPTFEIDKNVVGQDVDFIEKLLQSET